MFNPIYSCKTLLVGPPTLDGRLVKSVLQTPSPRKMDVSGQSFYFLAILTSFGGTSSLRRGVLGRCRQHRSEKVFRHLFTF